jgi:hypothetical protein
LPSRLIFPPVLCFGWACSPGLVQRPRLAMWPRDHYSYGSMRPSPKQKLDETKQLKSWRVSLLRLRAQYLGTVDAQDERTAQAAAVAQFNLNEEQRKRLAVREQD